MPPQQTNIIIKTKEVFIGLKNGFKSGPCSPDLTPGKRVFKPAGTHDAKNEGFRKSA
jgi:hypothetical protein